MKRAFVLCGLGLVAACGSPRRALTPRAAPDAASTGPSPAPSARASAAASATDSRTPVVIPGCTAENLPALHARLGALDRRIGRYDIEGRETILADVREAWEHPCLSHFARFFRAPPAGTSVARFGDLWRSGLGGSLFAVAGALYRYEGKTFALVPPEEPAEVTARQKAPFAMWLCSDDAVGCGHTSSYVERAHEAYDRDEWIANRWGRSAASDDTFRPIGCYDQAQTDGAKAGETPFETFVKCAASESPYTWRYPLATRMRARERGWLVMLGTRGHYEVTDELGIFDLSTGAAYIGRTTFAGGSLLPDAKLDPSDKERKTEIITGSVAVDQVRELAFLLATSPLLRAQRSRTQTVPLPDGLEVTLTSGRTAKNPFELAPAEWRTSGETPISWQLVDGGATVAQGVLMWQSMTSWQSHAADVTRVMEGGIERGCVPARPPSGLAQRRVATVYPRGTNRAVHAVFASLAAQLELDARPCTPK